MKKAEVQDFYLCIIWILKNINRDVFKKYLSIEVASKLMNIIRILSAAKEILEDNENVCKSDDDKKRYQKGSILAYHF